MRKLEAFLGVKVLTYCIMSNHFHLLVGKCLILSIGFCRSRKTIYLHDLLPVLYSKIHDSRCETGTGTSRRNDAQWTREILNRYQQRMGKLDVFMKELKQRFTQWYNRNNNRRGTLWERSL